LRWVVCFGRCCCETQIKQACKEFSTQKFSTTFVCLIQAL